MATWKTPSGDAHNLYLDILKQNHVLIAGASGSGKSVLVNGLITTLLYRFPQDMPGGAQMILIDPKRVELSIYAELPHVLRHATEPADMIEALNYAVELTERRYKAMQADGLRLYSGSDVYVIIEELADLMTTQRRTVQPLLQRLCQIARAAKVHVITVTQCPIVKVIPTEIKVNFDAIIALRTRSAQDSRNIIGESGAELLPKYGRCLYYCPDRIGVQNVSVPYVTELEQQRLVNWWTAQRPTAAAKHGFLSLFRRRA